MSRTKYDHAPRALSQAVRCISSSSWRTCLLRLLALAVFIGTLPLTSAFAATYTVTNLNDSGPDSLRDAIMTANSTTTDDMIVFSLGLTGTITLIAGELAIANNGSLSIDGEERITISGNDISRVFHIASGANVSLSGLAIMRGMVTAGDRGGGIRNFGTLTITNSVIVGNRSSFSGGGGGGVSNEGTLTIIASTLSVNTDAGFDDINTGGGGIFNRGTLTITNSTLSGNAAPYGGGINNHGTLTITNSTLSRNTGRPSGGGVTNNGGTVTITDSTLSSNSDSIGSGGILNRGFFNGGTVTIINSTLSGNSSRYSTGGIGNGGTLTITKSTISGNVGGNGGGISNLGWLTITNSTLSGNATDLSGGGIQNRGTAMITNSTFSGNSATDTGGGIFNSSATLISVDPGGGESRVSFFGELTITNSTLSGNSATARGGGIANAGMRSIINTINTIITNSTSGGDCVLNDPDEDTINAQHSLIEDGLDCVNGTNINNLTGDPGLGALTGSPAYFPLLVDSIAIDTGDNSLIPTGITTDQPGNPRIRNDIVDMGSFEFQVVPPAPVPPAPLPPAEVEEIPTLGQVALVLLGLLLSMLGIAAIRRGA